MSYDALVPSGAPAWLMRNCGWIWKLTLSVAPSMGMGTLVANDAAGARTRARVRALQVAFIGILHEIALRVRAAAVCQTGGAANAGYSTDRKLNCNSRQRFK